MSIVRVPLSSRKYPGLFAFVDEQDCERVSQYLWGVVSYKRTFYARTLIPGQGRVTLHRFILGVGRGVNVDHENHNGLDCRRCNIRPCDQSQNNANRKVVHNPSGYRGVYWDKRRGYWFSQVMYHRKEIYLGSFATAEEAAHAWDVKARELWGEFARLNFDPPHEDMPTPYAFTAEQRETPLPKSGFRNVYPTKEGKRWDAWFQHKQKTIRVGVYDTPEEASRAVAEKKASLAEGGDA